MAKIKKFIEDNVEREFDHLIFIYIIMAASAVTISGAIYFYARTPTTNTLIVLILVGCLIWAVMRD